jgi:hypothetical protein
VAAESARVESARVERAGRSQARELMPLERAVNESAGKVTVLWSSFTLTGVYLGLTSGSVTHRELLLDTAVRMPVLGVELPIVAYFALAPLIYLVFHGYLMLQLGRLFAKVRCWGELAVEQVPDPADRALLRLRLDDFPLLQFLARREDRLDLQGLLLTAVSWFTVTAVPLLVLLQMQLACLPYHSAGLTWLHRAVIALDLGMAWLFWWNVGLRGPERRLGRTVGRVAGIAAVVTLSVFSLFLATFHGEALHENWVKRGLDRVTTVLTGGRSTLSQVLFEGDVDEASGRSTSWFSSRLILPDQDFTPADPDAALNARGRDLRGAVFRRSSLRGADFTGSKLEGASFAEADLRGARFGCPLRIALNEQGRNRESTNSAACTRLDGVDFTGADLQGAVLPPLQSVSRLGTP